MKLVDSFVRRHPRFGIANLMQHYVIISAALFVMSFFSLIPAAVENHFAYRLVASMFLFGSSDLLMYIIALVCNFMIGRMVENSMGSARFTIYIALCFIFGIASFLTLGVFFGSLGITMSVFVAFACISPDSQVSLMMVIPIKAKYLCAVYVAYYYLTALRSLFAGDARSILGLLVISLPALIYFGGDLLTGIRNFVRRQKFRRRMK